MTGNRDALPGRYPWLLRLIVPLVVMSFVIWDTVARSRHILQVTASYGVTVDPPAIDAQSPTGYEQGMRSMLLPEADEDTAHWVMQTQAMIAQGDWRVRRVEYDNVPQGREVHWAAPLHWWLAFLAWIDHLVTGRSIGISVERATLASGVVMFSLWLLGLLPLLNRRFSVVAGAIVTIGAVAMFPFYTDFLPGRTDHHGLVNICSMFTVLLMAAGSLRPAGGSGKSGPGAPAMAPDASIADARERRAAQWWFAGSAVAGGVGLWISAATVVPVLMGLGLGVLAASWMGRNHAPSLTWMREPGLFRLWGLVGGGVSLIAYLIEYFPSHFGLRLEVNHPLYAVAWIGGGELLRLAVSARGGLRVLTRRDWALGALAAASVAVLPAIILATAAKTFTVADPFVWQLHTRYISEFQSLQRLFSTHGLSWNLAALCLPVFLLVPSLVMILRPSTGPEARAHLILALCPAVTGWIQGWNQIRWLGLAYALSVPAIAICFRGLELQVEKGRRSLLAWSAACGLLLMPGLAEAGRQLRAGTEFTTTEIRNLAQRDVAHWLRLRAGHDPVVVASSPTGTTLLISQGGLSGLATLYWENAEGLKHAAALFAAPSAEAAHELVRRFGVTHIVFLTWDAFELGLVKLFRDLPDTALLPTDAFMVNLLASPVPPPWLRAIPFTLPEHSALEGQQVRIWEVVPDQTPPEAAAHAANYYLETGQPDPGNQLAPMLARFGNDLAANVMLAGLESRRQDPAGFATAMAGVMARLRQAPSLPLDDHIHLVVVLTVGQQLELAREQLRLGVKKVDERSLRHLTPGTLSDLLSLCDGLGVDLPDPALKRLAASLVPPIRRK